MSNKQLRRARDYSSADRLIDHEPEHVKHLWLLSPLYVPVFEGKRQGINGAREVQKITALGSANVPQRVAADGRVADGERHQVAGPFATSVDSDALVMAAPLASQPSQNQTLVGHDYLGAGVVHKSPILPSTGNETEDVCYRPSAIDTIAFLCCDRFAKVLVSFESRLVKKLENVSKSRGRYRRSHSSGSGMSTNLMFPHQTSHVRVGLNGALEVDIVTLFD